MSLTPVISFLDETSKATLEKANYKTSYTDIPNIHPAVASVQESLSALAAELGIDYSLTGTTFTVNSKPGVKNIYMPSISNHKGVACLFWGAVRKPIADINVPMAVEEVNKRLVLQLELAEGDLFLSLMVARDKNDPKKLVADKGVLKRSLRDGSLGSYLATPFEKPKGLVELTPEVKYTVTDYKTGEYLGKRTFTIYVKEEEAWFKANSALVAYLEYMPEVTEDKPAYLVTGVVTDYVSGHPVVPAEFTTALKANVPSFDFD